MATCRAVGAEPVVVICYNSHRWSLDFDETPHPTRRQIIDTAVAWVRYANTVKGYHVKYWEIGNESWLPMEENGKTSTIQPEVYAEDVVEISRRMKEVDPTILIGANARETDDWTTILDKAAAHIDFLVVHPYPFYGWKGYDTYLRQDPDCHMALFWNTINIYEGDGSVFNALMRDNSLSAVGRALTIWSRFLEDDMVKTSVTPRRSETGKVQREPVGKPSPSMVRCYASKTEGKALNVILVNKNIRTTPIELTLCHVNLTDRRGDKWIYRGTSPTDKNPTWGEVGWVITAGDILMATLDPVSVTVFSFALEPNSGL